MSTDSKRRPYDSRARRAQAHRNRAAILQSARKRFLADGYAATTIATIADDAQLSIDTVYKTFGGKGGLVRAIYDESLLGSEATAAPLRSDALQDGEADARAVVRGWGALTAEVAPMVAPIHLLVRDAAASDTEMAALLRDSDDSRRARMRHNALSLADRGRLRPGITLEEATDIMWALSSPELFELLVLRAGWSPERFGRYVAESLESALLP
ncbi:TetR/AcrR family transcriptional regulator [Diaminobutyricibacter sp. McL0608]|uniref:TetR/AcrR family transcriptional regulator n=1 Tax=Leifsonia sp. McL0608 TaxID=3143537 RepID=UPI0031F30A73